MNFRRLALPLLAALAISLGGVVAQNINKSVQLSQDGSGPIGFDTNNNVYFPAHILNSGSVPAITVATFTAPTITGNDSAGQIIGSVTATLGATVLFRQAYLTTPFCVLTSQNPATSPVAYNAVTTGLNITSGIGTSIINFICNGRI